MQRRDSNYIHGFVWDVITNPCHNFNDGYERGA